MLRFIFTQSLYYKVFELLDIEKGAPRAATALQCHQMILKNTGGYFSTPRI